MNEEAASQALLEQGALGVIALGLAWACVYLIRSLNRVQEQRSKDALTIIQAHNRVSERQVASLNALTMAVQSMVIAVRGSTGQGVPDVAVREEE